jgi:hypothetical protein
MGLILVGFHAGSLSHKVVSLPGDQHLILRFNLSDPLAEHWFTNKKRRGPKSAPP